MMNRFFTLLILSIFAGMTRLSAQNDSITVDDYYIDFSVPDLGAFTLLNTKPDQITSPGSVKELAVSMLEIAGSGSTISPGIAIDWAPVKTFFSPSTQSDYKKFHLINKLQFTFGTVTDTSGVKVAGGIKWTLIDKGDPLLDDQYCRLLSELDKQKKIEVSEARVRFSAQLHAFLDSLQVSFSIPKTYRKSDLIYSPAAMNQFNFHDSASIPNDYLIHYCNVIDSITEYLNSYKTGSVLSGKDSLRIRDLSKRFFRIRYAAEHYSSDLTNDLTQAKRKWLEDKWNSTVLCFGAGMTGNSTDRKWESLRSEVFKTFLNGKFRLGKRFQLNGIVSYSLPEATEDTDSTIHYSFFTGGRIIYGNAKNRISFDFGYRADMANSPDFNNELFITNFGFEFKVSEGIFMEIAGGFTGPPEEFLGNAEILALGGLKYALRPNARFSTTP